MMLPKISVIVPAHNTEQYLEQCIRSIQNQTHSNLEIILVDDGSVDRTGEIADTIAKEDPRIKVIHQANAGVTSARLAGIQAATGTWIGFADSDDWLEPDMYARLLENALAHGAELSHCGYQLVFPDGHINYFHNSGKTMFFDLAGGLEALVEGTIVEPGVWNKLFHSKLFREPLNIDTSIRYNEDFLMNFLLFQRARCSVFEDFCPYHHRLRVGSATTSPISYARLRDPITVTRLIQARTSIPGVISAIEKRLIHQLIQGGTMFRGSEQEIIIPFRKQCRAELFREIAAQLPRNQLPLKWKFQAIWAYLSPRGYAAIHRLYLRLSGKDRLYSID